MTNGWLPDAMEPALERTGAGISLRQNALEPGFHDVPAGPAPRIVMLMVPV
jgi:hypothetical protein